MGKDVFVWKIHHGGISVANLDESIEWYCKYLGFELEKKQFIEQIPAHIAFIQRGDFRIELFEFPNANPLPDERRIPNLDVQTIGHKHLCFAVHDAKQAFAQLRHKNADIVFEAVIGGTAMGFLRDNTGNLIELIEFPDLWKNEGILE
ncbi:TPA: VOC family protein [Acinetobacter baumannii]|nr:VOC family protein [Acinetobacter baumannii]HEO1802613.1 VOC family protein [Acinetobacter baumannii]